ncbi:MAG: PH domain-containing protein [Mariniblastus sp.]|nr:PH domain-containing protein [Mariniblastus sp.]
MKPSSQERTLYEEHPSMFRNQPVAFVIYCVLCLVVVGIVILFFWWLKCKGTTLTVTTDRVRLRKGILSKSINEVWHQDVRNVQLNQSFFQRLFGVGTVGISSAGQSEIEISVTGIPDPDRVKMLIDQHRRR